MKLAPLIVLACLVATCAPNTAQIPSHSPAATVAEATPTPAASPTPSPTPPPTPSHVFLIVMENRIFSQAISNIYIAHLPATYANATNYHARSHPTLPNYT